MPGYKGTSFEEKVFTAALAIIEINNVAVGKIQNLSFTEQIARAEVQGIGSLLLQEVPPITARCTFQASSYMIEMSRFGNVSDPFWPVGCQTNQEFVDSMLLSEVPVNLYVYSKIPATKRGDLVTSTGKYYLGKALDCYLDSRVFTINEQQVAGKNITGRYLVPMQF